MEQPSLESKARQRQLSPGSVEHHRLASPTSAARQHQGGVYGQDVGTTYQCATDDLEGTRRAKALEMETTLRRQKHLRLLPREIAAAESAKNEADAAAATAQEAWNRARRILAERASTSPPRSTGNDNVYSRCQRPGDEEFFHASVTCIASMPLVEVSPEFRTAVVDNASALLQSVRRTSLPTAELLSAERAWGRMDNTSYLGQKRAAPNLALVFAL